MDTNEVARAVGAVTTTVTSLDLPVDNVAVIHNSNKLALRLLPCDVFARVAPADQEAAAATEIALAQQLTATGAPVAALDDRLEPRVYRDGGFAITFWTYHPSAGHLPPADYAHALDRLHAGMRNVNLATPHFTDRVDEALHLVTNPGLTPALDRAGRDLLADTLKDARRKIDRWGAAEQLVHGVASSGQRPQHGGRAALHRPRNLLPGPSRLRCGARARQGGRVLPGCRPGSRR